MWKISGEKLPETSLSYLYNIMNINKLLLFFLVQLGLSVTPVFAGNVVDDTLQSINVDDVRGIADGLRRGLDVNYADADGNTLLMLVARDGSVKATELLLNAGAKVYPSNVFGETALMLATYAGHEPVADMLLAKGADVNANPGGWTPLHYAAFAGYIRLANKFIRLGSVVDVKTRNQLTPLMVAAMNGHLEIVQALLKNGADPTLRDANNLSAYDHALARANTIIAGVLSRNGQKAKAP